MPDRVYGVAIRPATLALRLARPVLPQCNNSRICQQALALGLRMVMIVRPFVRRQRRARGEFSMIGLVLVTHGRLAVEFRAALEHVVGPQKQIEAVTIGPDDDVEQRRKDIIEAVKRVDTGDGVAILTDMFGGTPSNLAISVMSRPKVEVLAGINLPMLVKLAKVRDECSAGRSGRGRAGSRPQIHHHRQPGARREMSDDAEDRAADRGRHAVRRRIVRVLDDRQPEGPARPRLRQVRADGRALRREVRVTRGGETVGGTSIMGLMMLAAGAGHHDHRRGRRPGRPPR